MKSVVLHVIIFCVLFLQHANSLKKEDCIKGIQYFIEKGITGDGDCPNCPPDWKMCREEIIDNRKNCEDSCRPKPKPSQLVPSTHTNTKQVASSNSTSYKTASSTPTSYIGTPRVQHASSSVSGVNSSTEVNVDKKRRDEKEGNDKPWIISVSTVFGVVFAAGIVAVVWWCQCHRHEKPASGVEAGRVEEGELKPFQETETAVIGVIDEKSKKPAQEVESTNNEASSSLRLGGIQDSSALNLDEKCL